IHYDIRALLIKLADRLHNMRTLKSMKPEKQIKIAGETDYFYAPLANRLGLYKIKSELENLSLKYRSPHEYSYVEEQINNYVERHAKAAEEWLKPIIERLIENGIKATVTCDKRSVYSIWRRMQEKNISFKEVEHIRIVNITFENWQELELTEKRQALRIYSILTDLYTEKPGSLNNYIDTPKENGYHSLHSKLMGNEGRWMEVHIQSSLMLKISNFGCLVEREKSVEGWIEKFRNVLKDIAYHGKEGGFIECVIRTFYNDDIIVFAPDGKMITMPRGATALDYAYEIHSKIGNHAKYAIINDKLSSVFTELQHGDRVKIGTDEEVHPIPSWLNRVISYKAQQRIQQYLRRETSNSDKEKACYILCKKCEPLPGDEVIGFHHSDNTITIHKCNCPVAISEAAQQGDIIENVEFPVTQRCVHPITIMIKAVNRNGFLLELITEISQKYNFSIERIKSITTDEIIDCTVVIYVHSINELKKVEDGIRQMKNIYEVRHITHAV
ncbi:MAG: TGS domain-containing protein, partial [Bacteroidales bacterium]